MSIVPATKSRRRLTVLSAAIALVGGGVVVSNLASAATVSAVDYAQCQNGGPNSGADPAVCQQWINGILNANNSQFQEDQVTPQRLMVSFVDSTSGDHVHSVTLRYMARKATAHAYDYLASVDATVTDAVTKRCVAQPYADCSALAQGADADIVPDPTAVGPSATGVSHVTSLHMGSMPASQRKLKIFGATFTTGPQDGSGAPSNPPAMTTPQHDCADPCTGDDYAHTTISFLTNGTGTHYVQLLFGGHLAAGQITASQTDGWGVGFGASSISGGPYHIKWDAADGASVGNRDNQIQSSAIIPIIAQGTTMGSSATPTGDKAIGDSSLTTAHDVANLLIANTAHPPTGTASFQLYGPFTSAPGASDCVAAKAKGSAVTSTTWTVDGSNSKLYHATGSNVNLNTLSGVAADQYYEWVASYIPGTDLWNEASSSSCADTGEQVHITKAAASGTSTQTVTDTVTLTGNTAGGTPDGKVSWYLYKTSNCTNVNTGDLVDSDVVGDGGGDTNNTLVSGSATSKGITLSNTTATTYYWKVVYEGGTNYASSTVEACGTQTVTIDN